MSRASLILALIALVGVSTGCASDPAPKPEPAPAPTDVEDTAATDAPKKDTTALVDALKNGAAFDGYVTGGQPDAAALDLAQKAGMKTVISLRTSAEDTGLDERAEVEQRGMRFVNIEVKGAEGLTKENVLEFDQALKDAGEQDLIVHCGSGNRVGALFALRAFWLQGKDRDEALGIGKAHGLTRLEGAVTELVDKKPPVGH